MKKFIALIVILILTCLSIFVGKELYTKVINLIEGKPENLPIENKSTIQKPITEDGLFLVYVDNKLTSSFSNIDEAINFGKEHTRVHIVSKEKVTWLWDNYPAYHVFTNSTKDNFYEFESFAEAINFAKADTNSFVYYRKDNSLIWTNTKPLDNQHIIKNVPTVYQLPELPRGCEVTSLTMLLNYLGNSISKMTLADEIAKDNTPYTVRNGIITAGDPNKGFVGDMFNATRFGYGVYHKPIHELLTKYRPYSSMDMTGCEFEDLLYSINTNLPVWVIINTDYTTLPQSDFKTWTLKSGEQIQTTSKEHAVLIIGYDAEYIYFKDPLGKEEKALRYEFKGAWEQMGSQAVGVSGRGIY